jgi:hypothetical protein
MSLIFRGKKARSLSFKGKTMKRVSACLAVAIILAASGFDESRRSTFAQNAPARDLASLFGLSHGLVRDTNADGLADMVAARVIVPAQPTAEDTQAAIAIAARLGFRDHGADAAACPSRRRNPLIRRSPSADPDRAGEQILIRLVSRARSISSRSSGQGLIAHVRHCGADGSAVAATTKAPWPPPRFWRRACRACGPCRASSSPESKNRRSATSRTGESRPRPPGLNPLSLTATAGV